MKLTAERGKDDSRISSKFEVYVPAVGTEEDLQRRNSLVSAGIGGIRVILRSVSSGRFVRVDGNDYVYADAANFLDAAKIVFNQRLNGFYEISIPISIILIMNKNSKVKWMGRKIGCFDAWDVQLDEKTVYFKSSPMQ